MKFIKNLEKERIIIFSFVTAGIAFIPCSIIIIFSILQLINESEVAGMNPWWAIVLSSVLIPYTWFGNLVGALIGYTARSRAN
mgnify:CR=1 FL=1